MTGVYSGDVLFVPCLGAAFSATRENDKLLHGVLGDCASKFGKNCG